MGSILCEHCAAACCRYVALEIDRPRTARDFDDIRWYIMHQGISVFVEDGSWYIQFQARCRNLGMNNLCQVYTTRPALCREFEPGECDYCAAESHYEHNFTHAQQVEEYYFKKTGIRLTGEPAAPDRKRRRARRKEAVRA